MAVVESRVPVIKKVHVALLSGGRSYQKVRAATVPHVVGTLSICFLSLAQVFCHVSVILVDPGMRP